MDDAFLVRRFERLGDLPRDWQRFGKRHGTGQRRPLDVLHHQIIRPDAYSAQILG